MLPIIGSLILAMGSSAVITNEYHHLNPNTQVQTLTYTKEVYVDRLVHVQSQPDYWATLINIESAGGKLRYRPKSKGKACTKTSLPCGTHQLSKQAIVDINCKPLAKCLKDRDVYQASQKMANSYDKRLTKLGCHFTGWERYVCWNQGAAGARMIAASATTGAFLPNAIRRNMANNSPWSYKTLKSWHSKTAAKKFRQYRKDLWYDKMVSL